MSYVALTPAYYAAQQWGSAYHPGAPGWSRAPVPGWGENPNNSWPAMQAQNGLGAAAAPAPCTPPPCAPPAPPPFTYVAKTPWTWYIQQGISPWGRFPTGPAYAAPRPLACWSCVGTPVRPGIGSIVDASRAINAGDMTMAMQAVRNAASGLGGGCGPCQITDGDRCLPCPNGSDVDECQGCIDGQPVTVSHWYDHPLVGPVAAGVATAIVTGIAVSFLRKRHVPVG